LAAFAAFAPRVLPYSSLTPLPPALDALRVAGEASGRDAPAGGEAGAGAGAGAGASFEVLSRFADASDADAPAGGDAGASATEAPLLLARCGVLLRFQSLLGYGEAMLLAMTW
jgi:hypothetical protein